MDSYDVTTRRDHRHDRSHDLRYTVQSRSVQLVRRERLETSHPEAFVCQQR
jgi:hypothetical protein